MKLVFFGTPDYVVSILEELHKEFKEKNVSPIAAVVTQRPKPVGRKQFLSYSVVDNWAHKREIPVFYSSRELIKSGVAADLGVLAAYGEIIPPEVIKLFPHGILNIHPSLLPKYRGASPVQAAILSGDKETGVTIIKLDNAMDHGEIYSQFSEEILPEDTTDSLRRRLFARGAEVLAALIPPYIAGKIHPRKQDYAKATFTTRLKKEHGEVPFAYFRAALAGKSLHQNWPIGFIKHYSLSPTPVSINRFIKAMQPWPGAWTLLRQGSGGQARRLKIIKAHLAISHKPSAIKLVPDEVQLEGKTPVSWEEFKRGYPEAF